MRGVWITKHGGPEFLKSAETPDPTPSASEYRVRLNACGLNFAEVSARQGLYPERAQARPASSVYEGAGVVDMAVAGLPTHRWLASALSRLCAFPARTADTVCVSAVRAQQIPMRVKLEDAAIALRHY